jgi:hypothetical protein
MKGRRRVAPRPAREAGPMKGRRRVASRPAREAGDDTVVHRPVGCSGRPKVWTMC